MTLYSRWCWGRPNIWFPPKFQFSTRIVQWCTGSLAAPKRREYRLLPCMFQFLSFIHEGSCANGEQSMRPRGATMLRTNLRHSNENVRKLCILDCTMTTAKTVRWQLPKQSREPPTGWNERNRFVMDVSLSPFQHPDKCLCQCWTGEGHVWQRFDFKQRFRFWHIIPCMVCWWYFFVWFKCRHCCATVRFTGDSFGRHWFANEPGKIRPWQRRPNLQVIWQPNTVHASNRLRLING